MTTTLAIPAKAYDQVIRLKVSRAVYDALVENLGDDAHVRLTYDGETLELMSPGPLHEIISRIIAEMLLLVRLEWAINITDLGSTRFRPAGGQEFEADGAWYVDMATRVRDRKNVDLTRDAPPDILLETDITTDSIDKLAIFARMRVPEVWLYSLAGFVAMMLDENEYVPIETSRIIAGLPISEIKKRIEDQAPRDEADMYEFSREWQQWLQTHRYLHAE